MQLEMLDASTVTDVAPGELPFRHTGRLRGMQVTVTYAINEAEDERRRELHLGAVLDDRIVLGLMDLGDGDLAPLPAHLKDLVYGPRIGARFVQALEDPDGCVWVRRVLEPPVRPLVVEVHGARWTYAVARAHRWNNCAERVVVLSSLPRDAADFAQFEAAHYGVGLDVIRDGRRDRLVEPQTPTPDAYTAGSWELAEEIYAQFRRLRDS